MKTNAKIYLFDFEFHRLKVSYAQLKGDIGSSRDRDCFTLFFIRCYHLCDSLIKSGYSEGVVYSYVNQSRALSLCKDLANTLKHKKPRGSITNLGRFDPISRHKDWLGDGQVKTCVQPVEQAFPMDALELAHQCIQEWQVFLDRNPLNENAGL